MKAAREGEFPRDADEAHSSRFGTAISSTMQVQYGWLHISRTVHMIRLRSSLSVSAPADGVALAASARRQRSQTRDIVWICMNRAVIANAIVERARMRLPRASSWTGGTGVARRPARVRVRSRLVSAIPPTTGRHLIISLHPKLQNLMWPSGAEY